MAGIGSARWWLPACCLLVLAASQPAEAARLTLTAEDVGYIESDGPRPEGRMLVRFAIPGELRTGCVDLAVLELRAPVSSDGHASRVALEAHPLTTEWEGGTVSWDGAWTTPGGDYDASVQAVWFAKPGEGSVIRFDVTDVVAAWASDALANCGMIVAIEPGQPSSIGQLHDGGAATEAPVLCVWYTPGDDGR
ncbi:MAG: DNRLRE domain-containing protein [Candidatus Eisenbacteria bacterium]|nr:DNRLRE domain-containing protein [Candidatus Eisenbacteria bacterium]